MSERLPVGGFKWVEDASKFHKYFVKSYNKASDIGCFLESQEKIRCTYKNFKTELALQ